jgi:hypothetical protein
VSGVSRTWVDSSLILSVVTKVVKAWGCWGASKVGDDVSDGALHNFGSWGAWDEVALSIGRAGAVLLVCPAEGRQSEGLGC